jgi:hypothetical protein
MIGDQSRFTHLFNTMTTISAHVLLFQRRLSAKKKSATSAIVISKHQSGKLNALWDESEP